MSKIKKLAILFWTTFSISATTSGGYAIVSIMRSRFVEKLHWFEEDEMLDLVSIAQSAPGPIAINSSVLVGYRVAGISGALLTTFGTVLPPLVIMSIVTIFYQQFCNNTIVRYIMRGMNAGVAALLVDVTIGLFTNLVKRKSILSDVLMVISFIIAQLTDISFGYIAIFCALAGIIKVLIMKDKAPLKESEAK